MKFLFSLLAVLLTASSVHASAELSVHGRQFVARDGRVVVLRGVNVSTAAKIAPFDPLPSTSGPTGSDDVRLLEPLRALGLNVIRLLFIWEGYEPEHGLYNEAYLDRFAQLAATAAALGLHTVIDMHQDSFSRYIGDGCGVGFPAWVTGGDARAAPAYKDCGTFWAIKTAMSPAMHRAYTAFYKDTNGSRTGLIEAWRRVARRLRNVPGVIGYDLINEFWGDENAELGPLQRDIVAAIRSEDPTAIAFVEPGLLAVLGLTGSPNMDRPTFGAFAYAPHFYDVLAAGTQVYLPDNPITDSIFERMPRQAREWNVPLFVGEFGGYAHTKYLEPLMNRQYDLLDDALASGTQWNYTPTWSASAKDGWNSEDYSIVDGDGRLRANFVRHPFPRATAGVPLFFQVRRDRAGQAYSVELRWRNDPTAGNGRTEIYLPASALFGERHPVIETRGPGVACAFSADGQFLLCDDTSTTAVVSVRVGVAPPRRGD